MNEDKLFELLSNLDDDLIDNEIDKLLEGADIDMDSIKRKSYEKLNNKNKRGKGKKRLPYVVAACLCLLTITTVYADDISQVIKSFFNKTPVYSTIVDGDAYYLKEGYSLDDDIKIESLMVSKGNLEMEITTDLSHSKLGDISIIPQNSPNAIYSPGGHSHREGDKGNEYFFLFVNQTEKNHNIKPFKDFELIIAGKSYDISLEKAKSFDSKDKIYASNPSANDIKGVNIGAKINKENKKLNIQLITSFEDKDLQLYRFGGKPTEKKLRSTWENLGEEIASSSEYYFETCNLYVVNEIGNRYELEIPQNPKAYPITIFETNAPKDSNLTLKIPSITTSYTQKIDSLSLSIPKEGEVTLNKEIDFKIQKAVLKNIKRISPTSASVEFELNTDSHENISIIDFNFYSTDIKKVSAEFSSNKGVMNLEFDENIDTADIEISYPKFEMNGDWVVNLK